jgi:hypothetical protein
MNNMSNDEFKINLRIGERYLPVTCKREDEADYRKAASIFNDAYSNYKIHYERFDEKDLLRMSGFHFSLKSLTDSKEKEIEPLKQDE